MRLIDVGNRSLTEFVQYLSDLWLGHLCCVKPSLTQPSGGLFTE
jgi:hypothetical protein